MRTRPRETTGSETRAEKPSRSQTLDSLSTRLQLRVADWRAALTTFEALSAPQSSLQSLGKSEDTPTSHMIPLVTLSTPSEKKLPVILSDLDTLRGEPA